MFLTVFTIFTACMAVASLRTSVALAAVFSVLLLTFMALTIAEFSGAAGLGRLGGWLGLATEVLAWYASFAVVLNTTWARQSFRSSHKLASTAPARQQDQTRRSRRE